jgi:hypothetical protein
MTIETLIKALKEDENQESLKSIEKILQEQHCKASCGAEAVQIERLIDLIYKQPSKLELVALEMGIIYRDNKGALHCKTVVEGEFEATFEFENEDTLPYIDIYSPNVKGAMFGEDRADEIRNVYPEFFEEAKEPFDGNKGWIGVQK